LRLETGRLNNHDVARRNDAVIHKDLAEPRIGSDQILDLPQHLGVLGLSLLLLFEAQVRGDWLGIGRGGHVPDSWVAAPLTPMNISLVDR
jgi:hypothetical protein